MPYWAIILILAIVAPGVLGFAVGLSLIGLSIVIPIALGVLCIRGIIRYIQKKRNPIHKLNKKYLKDRLKHL